jgi:nucleotide-binding universal stress UspA family protein
MSDSKRAFERAMRLAVVSGLRSTFGVALMEAAYDRPNRKMWALAALGEMAVDKIPGVPSRASLPAMLPRAIAGGYVAKQVMDREGVDDPWAVPMAAAVAAGVAALAPRIRGLLGTVLGVPNPVLGMVEDYIALKVGGEALGLSMDDLKQIGAESFEDVKGYVASVAIPDSSPQSVGAGSM